MDVIFIFFVHFSGDLPASVDLPAPAVTTKSESDTSSETSGKCLGYCATNKKMWAMKCNWKNRCDACSDCAGGYFPCYRERVIEISFGGMLMHQPIQL